MRGGVGVTMFLGLVTLCALVVGGCPKDPLPPPVEVFVAAGGLEISGDYVVSTVSVTYGEGERESHGVTRALTLWVAEHMDLKVVSVMPCRKIWRCGSEKGVTIVEELVILAYRPRDGEAER